MFGDGLQTIEMRCLNRIVVLAGANGAGKTRLLNRIATTGLKIDSRMKGMELDSPTQNLNAVMFVSKNTELIDPANLKIAELSSLAERAETLGANHLVQTTLPYIHRVQNQWREATHPHNPSSELREAKERSYTELQILIKAALGVELSRDQNGNATLFGRPIAQCRLSDGQVALLQWCVALHAQGLSLTEQILLMDEPENHLHPEALIATIERIIAANSQGQIWIATHSVPLIAFSLR